MDNESAIKDHLSTSSATITPSSSSSSKRSNRKNVDPPVKNLIHKGRVVINSTIKPGSGSIKIKKSGLIVKADNHEKIKTNEQQHQTKEQKQQPTILGPQQKQKKQPKKKQQGSHNSQECPPQQLQPKPKLKSQPKPQVKSELELQSLSQPQSQKQPEQQGQRRKTPPSSQTGKSDTEEKLSKKARKRARRAEKKDDEKKRIHNLEDPSQILATVLAKGTTPELNLSDSVSHILQQDNVRNLLKGLDFEKRRIDILPTDVITVLPRGFEGMVVNVGPFAITSMNCINESPPKRFKKKSSKKRAKGSKSAQAGGQSKQSTETVKQNGKNHQHGKDEVMKSESSECTLPCFPDHCHIQDPYVLRWMV